MNAAPTAPTPASPTPIHLPSAAILVLSVVAAVLAGLLRAHVFDVFGNTADSYVAVALAVLGAFVGPVTSGQFRNLVHLPQAAITVIGVVILIAQTLLVGVHDVQTSAILVSIVTFAAWLGFGPGVVE
jgi:hypothetical protein